MRNLQTHIAIGTGLLLTIPATASAQEISLNYDRLASLEEPLAYDFGNITVEVTGVADVPVLMQFDDVTGGNDPQIEVEFVGNFQVAAETQLSNRWTVGAAYFGQFSTDPRNLFLGNPMGMGDYNDNVAGFIATSFGSVIGGNVNQQVREITRRQRGVGNGFLAFDDFYGQLDRWGGAYVGRFGPTVFGAVVDENGDFEAGAVFQRPIGRNDLRFSGRVRQGRFMAADGLNEFESLGFGAVGEIEHGSSIVDLGVGYEMVDGDFTEFDRWFVSAGTSTQLGGLRLSGEAHYGEAAGQREISTSLGAAYDISRGLSVNLGVNAEEARITSDGISIIETDQITAVASARFSF